MSRGFHAFFRQYYNLRALLRRADPGLAAARARSRTTRCGWPAGPPTPSPASRARPPLNMLGLRGPLARASGCATWPPSTSTRRWGCSTSTSRGPSPSYDGISAAEVLDRLRFPARRPPPGAGGLRPQLLRRPAGLLRRRAGRDVPRLLPRLGRGPALRRARRRLRHRAVGAAGPLPRRPRGRGADRRRRSRSWHEGPAAGVGGRGRCTTTASCAPTPSCWPPTGRRCSGSSARPAGSGDEEWRTRLAGLRPAPRVRGAGGCGSTGRSRPATPPFLATSGLRPAGQRLGARAVRGRRGRAGRAAARRVGGRAARLRRDPGPRRGGAAGPAAGRAARSCTPSSTTPGSLHEEWLVREDCPLVGTDPWASRPGVDDPRPAGRAGRRRHPLRAARGPDGARRHHRLAGRRRPARRLGRGRPRRLERPRRRPQQAGPPAASRAAEAAAAGRRDGAGGRRQTP